MPQTIIGDPTPAWLRPENVSVFDSIWVRAARRVAQVIGMDDPQGQVLMLMNPLVPKGQDTLGPMVEGIRKTIKAFHGSPHDFDKFSMEKIGTGEGAQAYGHGLYFAENESTAKAYRDQLSGGTIPSRNYYKGNEIVPSVGDVTVRSIAAAQKAGVTHPDHARAIADQVQQWVSNGRKAETFLARHDVPEPLRPAYEAAAREWSGVSYRPNKGRMYEVAINADPEEFLDWDKPLSQQPKVLDKLDTSGASARYMALQDRLDSLQREGKLDSPEWNTAVAESKAIRESSGFAPTVTGEELHRSMWADADAPVNRGRQSVVASERLKQAGIPGIKYLDQGSRGRTGGELIDTFEQGGQWFAKIRKANVSGGVGNPPADMFTTSMPLPSKDAATKWANEQINQGTHNYVVFDDSKIDILRKFGVALPVIEALRQKAKANGGMVSREDVDAAQGGM